MDETLNKIKQFENTLKMLLLETYGKFLPEDKISLLNATNYTTTNLLDGKTSSEIRGDITRRMLDDLIDLRCTKEIVLFDGNTIDITYGGALEETLINYYANQLSEKYHFDINKVEGLNEDLETVKLLYEKLGDGLDISVFNEDAMKLLTKADIKEITEKYDQKELESYFEKAKRVAGIASVSKQEQNDLLKENTERDLSVQIVWIHDRKHIKYTDPYGEVHLTDIHNLPRVEEFYKQKLATLNPDEKLDPEEFYHELQKYYASEMELMSTKDIKEDELNSKQVDMLAFVKSNQELQKAREQDIMKHNSQMDIHVMASDKSIVATEDKDDYVEASIIKDGSADIDDSISQKSTDISSQLISKEEYIRLNNKLFNGENLSLEELEALRRAAPVYAEEVFNDMQQQSETSGVQLKPKNPYNTGFTIKTFALYFVVLTILIATTVAIILLR